MKISFQASSSGRIDKLLHEELSQQLQGEISRSAVEHFIEQVGVLKNGGVVHKNGTKVQAGDRIECEWIQHDRIHHAPAPYDIPLTIIYEDDALLVINKPAGLTVHPGAGNQDKTLLNALVSYLGKRGIDLPSHRLGIVHRLDKDTSGILVVAKNDDAHFKLQRQFAERTTDKNYLALAYIPERGNHEFRKEDAGIIESALARSSHNRLKMVVSEEGKESVTEWSVIERFRHAVLLSIKIRTGRTHQIRAHIEASKSGVIGDTLYNEWIRLPSELEKASASLGRQALHAKDLSFTHPVTGERLSFTAPLPEDFENIVAAFRTYG